MRGILAGVHFKSSRRTTITVIVITIVTITIIIIINVDTIAAFREQFIFPRTLFNVAMLLYAKRCGTISVLFYFLFFFICLFT
jgi:hypothetical protein